VKWFMGELVLEVQKWRKVIGSDSGVSWDAPFKKLKFRYENSEWQQVETNLDMFKDLDHVKNVCGDGYHIDSLDCWLDAYHQSILNKSPITHDIYQFITHRAEVIRTALEHEISNFHIDWEMVLNTVVEVVSCIFLGGF
jgi:hypothetical protein